MAVTIAVTSLASILAVDIPTATRLHAVATLVVEEYAPLAPSALQDEAVIRFAGYLAQASSAFGVHLQKDVGPLSVRSVVNHSAMFRNSGAAALLTRYKVRRGGVI